MQRGEVVGIRRALLIRIVKLVTKTIHLLSGSPAAAAAAYIWKVDDDIDKDEELLDDRVDK